MHSIELQAQASFRSFGAMADGANVDSIGLVALSDCPSAAGKS